MQKKERRVGEHLSKKLWTLHPPCFSLTKGRVDHKESENYCDLPGAKEAYHELWSRQQILDGQVVWCYTDESLIRKTGGIEKIKWELSVPDSKIICFIDDLVWNRILGKRYRVPDKMRQWDDEALKKYPNDLNARKDYKGYLEESFWNREPVSGSWWCELFTENTCNGESALIRHPIPCEWIIGHEIWCC